MVPDPLENYLTIENQLCIQFVYQSTGRVHFSQEQWGTCSGDDGLKRERSVGFMMVRGVCFLCLALVVFIQLHKVWSYSLGLGNFNNLN